jgi:cobaltochelatase CobT
MLRRDILCENIDGEALEWAASRLSEEYHTRRIILVFSDGAPVDDSTLMANDDRTILRRHIEAVESQLTNAGFIVGFLQIGEEYWRPPILAERGQDPKSCSLAALELLRRSLCDDLPKFCTCPALTAVRAAACG